MGQSVIDKDGNLKVTGLSGEVLHRARINGPFPSDATAVHNTWTQVDQSNTIFDVGGLADPAGDRIVIQRTGTYLVGAQAQFVDDSQGHQIGVRVRRNGAQLMHARHWEEASTAYQEDWTSNLVRPHELTAGDVLVIDAWNYGAGAGNAVINSANTSLWVIELPNNQAVDGGPVSSDDLNTALAVSSVVWQRQAYVNATSTTAKIFADNGNVADFNGASGYRGIIRIDPAAWATGGRNAEFRANLSYATLTAPNVKVGCSLYPVTSISGGGLTVGTQIDSAQTVGAAAANELGGAITGWNVISSAGFYVAFFEWDAVSAATDTAATLTIEARQQP